MYYKRAFFAVVAFILYLALFRKSSGNEKRKLTAFTGFHFQFQPSHSRDNRIDYTYSHPMETDTVCHLPYTIPDNYDIRYYLESREKFKCPPSKFKDTVKLSPNGTIRLQLKDPLKHKCFYIQLSGTLHPNANQVRFVDKWTALKEGLQMSVDQFVVRCLNEQNQTTFLDAFAHIPDKKLEQKFEDERLNVVLLVLDSVSKSQFQRHMPKSMRFFDEHDAPFMHGYTSNSYDTDLNMLSMLAAKVYDAKKYGFRFKEFKYWMNTDLEKLQRSLLTTMNPIFVQAQKNGYLTMYNEDLIKESGGLFHENKFHGYSAPPSNYYYRPFYQYLYSNFQNNDSKICLNGKITGHRTLDLMSRFSTKYRDIPHFSFNFVGTTHHNPNDLQLLDNKLASILKTWENNGVLERTALIVTSNHGQLEHPIHTTFHGRVEERNPVLIVHLPKKYKEERPKDVRVVKINENRLTTHIDLYETTRELLRIKSENQTGRSLFTERPSILPCRGAQIPDHMCPCWEDDGFDLINEKNMQFYFVTIQTRIEQILETIPCIKEYYMLIPDAIYTYSLAAEVHKGERNLTAYRKRQHLHRLVNPYDRLPFIAEYFDIEAITPMTAVWKDDTKTNFAVRSRVTFNMLTNEMQYVLRPIVLSFEGCDEYMLDNICNCF